MTTGPSATPPTPRAGDETQRARPSRRSLHRGDPGVWSWVLHRITGAAIFFFVFVHVLDTALVRINPQVFDEVAGIYKAPIVQILELALVAAVIYHALNGVRVVLVDYWPKGAHYQRLMVWTVGVAWLLLTVPAAVVMGLNMFRGVR